MNGSYENPNADKPFKNTFQIEHYPSSGKSRLLLYRPQTNSGPMSTLGMTIIPAKETGLEKVSFIFSQSELKIFADFIRKCGSDLPFYCSVTNGVVKMIKSSLMTSNREGNQNNNNRQQASQNRDNNVPPAEFDFESGESAVTPTSVDTMEEYDWNFE